MYQLKTFFRQVMFSDQTHLKNHLVFHFLIFLKKKCFFYLLLFFKFILYFSSFFLLLGEIVEGLEDIPDNDKSKCFVFNRVLTNFDERHSNAAKYLDYQNGSVDVDAQNRLGKMRDYINAEIPASNIHR